MEQAKVRIAALSDIHCTRTSEGMLKPIFSQINASADVLLLCGDLTDYGMCEEAKVLAEEIKPTLQIPVIAVLGNHDYESGKPEEVKEILTECGVTVLDGDSCQVQGIEFVGVKGFAGGFGRGMLEAWGESCIKSFVQEAVNEALKLESALARRPNTQKIALLHYAPITRTLEGEPLEIFPFLGSSRLEEPLLRHNVAAVFHGHAHAGSPEGQLKNGVPVYNVALPLMRRYFPDQPPFRQFEVAVPDKQPVGLA